MQIARFCRDWFRIRQARNSALNFSTEHQDYAYFRLVFFQLMCKLQLRGGAAAQLSWEPLRGRRKALGLRKD